MIEFKHRYCKVHMARYVNGDLAEPVRRRVARYIDESEDCFREYMRHREFALKLERCLPTFGRPSSQRLDELWSSLQMDLQNPSPRPAWLRDFGARSSLQFSYGLVIIAISIALMLPLMIGYHSSLLSIDLRHAPQFAAVVLTPARDLPRSPFVATSHSKFRALIPLLQNTPSPRF
jgi:anti-sigma factor RsiW